MKFSEAKKTLAAASKTEKGKGMKNHDLYQLLTAVTVMCMGDSDTIVGEEPEYDQKQSDALNLVMDAIDKLWIKEFTKKNAA